MDAVGRRHLSRRLLDHLCTYDRRVRPLGRGRKTWSFRRVATVVAKLLLSARPDVALFGDKDFQQLAVIRRMVADLNIATEIAGVPTVREEDGLALSTRNAYLSDDERRRAIALPRALDYARKATSAARPSRLRSTPVARCWSNSAFSRIDYFALVDATTLEPLRRLKVRPGSSPLRSWTPLG